MTDFRFDPNEHRYHLAGREILGLTKILNLAGFYDFEFVNEDVLERAKARGTAVHLATALYDRRRLDPASVHPEIAGYLEGWKSFIGSKRVQVVDIERPIFSKAWLFACTPDRTVFINGKMGVLEIKASDYLSPAYQLQTEGQKIAVEEFYKIKCSSRFVVRLFDNGTFKLEQFRDAADRARFLASLTIARFKKERGIL